jgi:hypothetical protein
MLIMEKILQCAISIDGVIAVQVPCLNVVGAFRACAKTTSHFRITSSGHLCLLLNGKILKIACYSCGFAISDRTNLT